MRCDRLEADACAAPQLGYITLARSLMQALSSPIGGFLGARPVTGRLFFVSSLAACIGAVGGQLVALAEIKHLSTLWKES